MEHNFSWLAIRGVEPEAVRARLALTTSGEKSSEPEADVSTTTLPGGWVLVFAPRFDYVDQAPLAELSGGGEVITCCANEAMMFSSISGWRDGTRTWYFIHDGDMGIQHMHLEGNPPPEFHTIANRLNVIQAEGAGIDITVDHIFEIPMQAGQALTGFRLDEKGEIFQRLDVARLRPVDLA